MIALSYIRLRDGQAAHDPAMGARPRLESQREEFTDQQYRLSLDESSGMVSVKSREVPGVTTYVHVSACRFVLAQDVGDSTEELARAFGEQP